MNTNPTAATPRPSRCRQGLKARQTIAQGKRSSARFYEKVLKTRPVKDLFIIRRDLMRDIARRYFARQERRLAKAGERGQIQ